MAPFRASGQSKTKYCEQNAIARSTLILWGRCLLAGDGGHAGVEHRVVRRGGGPRGRGAPPRASRLSTEVTAAGLARWSPIRKSRCGLEKGRGWPRLPDLRARQPGEDEWGLEVGLVTPGRIMMCVQGARDADHALRSLVHRPTPRSPLRVRDIQRFWGARPRRNSPTWR